jgi:hypothetical protein
VFIVASAELGSVKNNTMHEHTLRKRHHAFGRCGCFFIIPVLFMTNIRFFIAESNTGIIRVAVPAFGWLTTCYPTSNNAAPCREIDFSATSYAIFSLTSLSRKNTFIIQEGFVRLACGFSNGHHSNPHWLNSDL